MDFAEEVAAKAIELLVAAGYVERDVATAAVRIVEGLADPSDLVPCKDTERLNWLALNGRAVRSASNATKNIVAWQQYWPDPQGNTLTNMRATIDAAMTRDGDGGRDG